MEQCENTSPWGVSIAITLLGVFLSASAQAAVFTVNSPFDVSDASPGNGVCETAPGNGVCTLRAAIQETNALPGADTIILPPNTYLLTNVTELIITSQSNLTITGAGALTTIIDGNKNVRSVGRVLRLDNQAIVSISGVTIRNGVDFGCGGIASDGELTLTNSTVSGNSAIGTSNPNGPSGSNGGGICTGGGGTLRLINSIVSGNSANGAGSQSGRSYGGGIYGIFVALTNSTVSGNSAIGTSPSFGGGIYGFLDTTVTNSTVSGNSAAGNGGGIYNSDGRTFTLTNSTVSGNSAARDGGGIYNFQNVRMSANLFNTTITQNQAGSGAGGIFNVGNPLAFRNTILAGNLGTECGGMITSNGNNLIGSVDCGVTGGGFTVADPKLGPLQNNGGPTLTHALLPGSPAIDAGNPNGCRGGEFNALLTTDQRGFPRPADGNNDGLAICDIGAYEFSGDFATGAAARFYYDVDFDGDGRNDIAVYRDGVWWILRSSNGGGVGITWGGAPQDIPVPGDYDGDGKTDQAVYRDGVWWIWRSSNGVVTSTTWGGFSVIPSRDWQRFTTIPPTTSSALPGKKCLQRVNMKKRLRKKAWQIKDNCHLAVATLISANTPNLLVGACRGRIAEVIPLSLQNLTPMLLVL